MRFNSVGIMLLALSSQALAQSKDERSNGLPKSVSWTFNFDAGIGAFGFGNSLYTNAKLGRELREARDLRDRARRQGLVLREDERRG
jgi:hypothetical protein